jgi:uncharacterized integral membrane protein
VKAKLIIGIVLLVLVLVFTFQNTALVPINFLFWDVELNRALLIFLTTAIGFVAGWFMHSVFRAR